MDKYRLRDNERRPLLIAGGRGIINPEPVCKFIDVFFIGEAEDNLRLLLRQLDNFQSLADVKGIYIPHIHNRFNFDFSIKSVIDSEPVVFRNRAVIELSRGCKHKCSFCQYSFTSGKHREKDFELIKRQILEVKGQGVRIINFKSTNLGNYSQIRESRLKLL